MVGGGPSDQQSRESLPCPASWEHMFLSRLWVLVGTEGDNGRGRVEEGIN